MRAVFANEKLFSTLLERGFFYFVHISEISPFRQIVNFFSPNLPLTMQNVDIERIASLLPVGYNFLSGEAEKLTIDDKNKNLVNVSLLAD